METKAELAALCAALAELLLPTREVVVSPWMLDVARELKRADEAVGTPPQAVHEWYGAHADPAREDVREGGIEGGIEGGSEEAAREGA
jgi:hypothetical protein